MNSSPTESKPDTAAANRRVRGPAMALILVSILMFVLSAVGLYFCFITDRDWSLDIWMAMKDVSNNANYQEWVQNHIDEHIHRNRAMEKLFVILVTVVRVIVYSIVFLAGFRMLARKSYGLCIIGAILTLIFNGAFCAGLPVGIWALVILCQPAVRDSFDATGTMAR